MERTNLRIDKLSIEAAEPKAEDMANASKKAPKAATAGSFKPGHSGGPGRPMGCRNQVTIEFERIGAEKSQDLYDSYMHMALVDKNERAHEFFLNKLWPNTKGVRLDLKLGSSKAKTLSELDDISARVLELMVEGEISADEAVKCGEAIAQRATSISEASVEKQIVETCQKIDQIKGGK